MSATNGASAGDGGRAAFGERPRFSDVDALARHLIAKAACGGGFRTIVTSEEEGADVAAAARALARAVAAAGRQVVLVDWDCAGSTSELPRPPGLGLGDMLLGEALFEDVIRREPASAVHLVGAGRAVPGGARAVDPGHLNLVLDALDEAYEHILVYGGYATSRTLFEAIEGRFDAAVVVERADARSDAAPAAPGTLFGFEVIEIEIVAYAPTGLSGLLRRLVHGAIGSAVRR